MFMLIREGPAAGSSSSPGPNGAPEKTAKQVQAAIKKKLEKQRRRTNETVGSEEMENSMRPSKAKAPSLPPAGEEEQQQAELESSDLVPMVASVYGADRELRPEEFEELREAFREFDKKKKGYLKCTDLGECMRTMGYMPTEMELIELSQTMCSGKIDFEDFVELMSPKMLAETADMIGMKELRDAFSEFDSNGDGRITLPELREAMKKLLGEQLSPRDVDEILKDVDLNGDGLLDFEEFVRMMSR